MPELFNGEDVDLSALYRDPAAPKDPDPSEVLFGDLGRAIQPTVSPGKVSTPARPAGTTPPPAGRDGYQGVPTGSGAAPQFGGAPAAGASADSQALLARLKPLGVTNLTTLRGKSDVELRKLSQDVVAYEIRQQNLAKSFRKNPDGSWDFTMGPDGQPTGLDAMGKTIPPGGTAKPVTPAKPASSAPAKPAAPPAAKPAAAKPVAKPAAKKAAPKKKAPAKKTVTRPKPKSKPKAAPRTTKKVTRPPVKKTATRTVSRQRRVAS